MKMLGSFTYLLIRIVIKLAVFGLVLSKMWEWFISNTFNVTTITIYQAVGIILIFNFFFNQSEVTKIAKKKERDVIDELENTKVLFAHLVYAMIAWGIGWCVYQVM